MSDLLKLIGLLLVCGILAVVIIVAGAIIGALVSVAFPVIILFTVGWFLWMCMKEHKEETKGKK